MYKVPYIDDVSRKLVGKQTKGTKDVQHDGTTPGAIKVPKGAGNGFYFILRYPPLNLEAIIVIILTY